MSTDLPLALVRNLRPGDLLNLSEVGEDAVRIGWLIDPWMGRSAERRFARTHNAEVHSVSTSEGGGSVITFTNFYSWYLPAGLAVRLQKP